MGSVTTGTRDGTVLIVDDHPSVRRMLVCFFEAEGFAVLEETDGESAVEVVRSHPVDVVLLDLGLPRVSGLEVLARIRAISDVPVIIVTGRELEPTRTIALEAGANDVVVKPMPLDDLLERVEAVLRHGGSGNGGGAGRSGGLSVDRDNRKVVAEGRLVRVNSKELALLARLTDAPGQVVSTAQLCRDVWGESQEHRPGEEAVIELVRDLRYKLEPDPHEPRWIKSVPGVGYRFEP